MSHVIDCSLMGSTIHTNTVRPLPIIPSFRVDHSPIWQPQEEFPRFILDIHQILDEQLDFASDVRRIQAIDADGLLWHLDWLTDFFYLLGRRLLLLFLVVARQSIIIQPRRQHQHQRQSIIPTYSDHTRIPREAHSSLQFSPECRRIILPPYRPLHTSNPSPTCHFCGDPTNDASVATNLSSFGSLILLLGGRGAGPDPCQQQFLPIGMESLVLLLGSDKSR